MIKRKSLLIALLLVLASLFTGCNKSKLQTTTITIKKADGSTAYVKAEIARKEEERNFGFMERKVIPDGTGMIFIFEQDQILSFWMKNTPHPLSIAYIDSKGKIRNIYDMTPYSLAHITSTSSVRYALEVPQGWFKKQGIKEGDFVILDF
jgi:uncharacterized membrane protein (UPF0127 family)